MYSLRLCHLLYIIILFNTAALNGGNDNLPKVTLFLVWLPFLALPIRWLMMLWVLNINDFPLAVTLIYVPRCGRENSFLQWRRGSAHLFSKFGSLSSNENQVGRSNRCCLWDSSKMVAVQSTQMCTWTGLNVFTKVTESSVQPPASATGQSAFCLSAWTAQCSCFVFFLSRAWDQTQGLPCTSRNCTTKPPHGQPSSSRSFLANYNFSSPVVSKISVSHRFLCISSFSLMWGRPSRCFLAHRTHCYALPPLSLEKRLQLLKARSTDPGSKKAI